MKEKSKERVIVIDHFPFIADTVKRELRQWNQPANRIAFENLQKEGNYFRMLFNQTTKMFTTPLVKQILKVQGLQKLLFHPFCLKYLYRTAIPYSH